MISLKICTGNNIPQDIVQALSVAIQQNSDRQVAFEEHQAQTEALTRELEMTQEKKRQEVCSFAVKLITDYQTGYCYNSQYHSTLSGASLFVAYVSIIIKHFI